MQLFTIGLWELNLDGTLNLDTVTGERRETYTIDDIVSFARVWTGWDDASPRGNIGVEEGGRNPDVDNIIDPMKLSAEKRDMFAKARLGGPTVGGHLGDGFPLCGKMAPRQFLRKGARFEYHGRESLLGFVHDNPDGRPNIREHFAPDPANSALYEALCDRRAMSDGAQRCSFPVVVTLDADLNCYGAAECGADLLRAVKIVDGDNVAFYSYAEPPCARLQFYQGNLGAYADTRVCADPTVASTVGSMCCYDPDLQLAEGPACPATHPFYENNSGDEDEGDLCVHETETWTCPRGCEATSNRDSPKCVLPTPTAQPGIPLSGGNNNSATNLQACTGECDSDGQCATGLICFQRDNNEAIPGCMSAGEAGYDYCYDPALAVPCHLNLGGVASSGGGECKFVAEPVKYATASARCAAEYDGGIVCPSDLADLGESQADGSSIDWQATCAGFQFAWTSDPCTLQVQVFPSGEVSIVDRSSSVDHLERNSGSRFRVAWGSPPPEEAQRFPTFTFNCTSGCQTLSGGSGSCLCDVEVEDTPLIESAVMGSLPTPAELRAALFVGALPPEQMDDSPPYSLCTTALCTSRPGVQVYTRSSGSPTFLDTETIFEFTDTPHVARPSVRRPPKYLKNQVSTVHVGSTKVYSMLPLGTQVLTSTPCEDAGLLPVSQTECEEAYPFVVPPGTVVLEGSESTNKVGDWDYKPPGCSLDAGSDSNGDYELQWNKRPRSYDWQPRYRPVCRQSTGSGRTGFQFRNPPNFIPTTSDGKASPYGDGDHLAAPAVHETAALIDHLFEHKNTAPFVAFRMIQRLVTSNPTPRYVRTVAMAFQEGEYGGVVHSGEYGCMSATVAAIMLDREARSSIVDHDQSHGQFREPILKVLHMLRSMEYASRDGGGDPAGRHGRQSRPDGV